MQNKAYKFRFYPDKEHVEYLDRCFKGSNVIYNYFLGLQKEIDDVLTIYGIEKKAYKNEHKLWFNAVAASKELTELSKGRLSFLSEIDSTVRSSALDNLDRAFKNIKTIGSGFPKFKSKKHCSFSGQIIYNGKDAPQNFKIVESDRKWCLVTLPGFSKFKLNPLQVVIHNEEFLEGYRSKSFLKINSYTISRNSSGEYYISFQVVDNTFIQPDKKEINEDGAIGIDLGVVRPITTSDPKSLEDPLYSDRFDFLKDDMAELKRLQRILSKKKERNPNWKNSNKYKRIRNKISKLHGKIANKRKDRQHNISKKLVNEPGINTIIFEDLKLKNMTKRSGKGLSKKKKGLTKSLLDVGMNTMVNMVTYKAAKLGINVEKVSARYTSQKCSNIKCGHINKLNRVTQAVFCCVKCGHQQNADLNAARSTKNKFFNKD